MAGVEKLRGLTLSRRNVGEADRLLRVLTSERGLVKILAKGVRKIPSRRGAHTEPFRQVMALVAGSPGRYFLSAVETENYYHELHEKRDDLARVGFLAKVIVNTLEEGEPQPEVFEGMCQACKLMPSLSREKKAMLEVSLYLLILNKAGLMPLLDSCRRCGERQPRQAVVLEAGEGGWFCLGCCSNLRQAASSFGWQGLSILRFLSQNPGQSLLLRSEGYGEQLVRIVRDYVVQQMWVRG